MEEEERRRLLECQQPEMVTQPSTDISRFRKTAKTLITFLFKRSQGFGIAVIPGDDPNTLLNQSRCQRQSILQALIKTNFTKVTMSKSC